MGSYDKVKGIKATISWTPTFIFYTMPHIMRKFLFISATLMSVVLIYRGLGDAMVGYTGVPMAFQQYVELDSDRYIVKTGAGAKIVVNAGGKASDKYRRLSFVISGLTDYTEAVPVMTYSDSAGNKQQTEFSSFFNGNNCSDRLKVGKWTTFEVLPNTYAHINIEKVYLSRYSMLPNSFIPLFLLFSAVVVTILYLFLYKGVYNKLEKLRFSNCILVAVIIVAQLGVIAYHTKHKTYLEIDEVWAYQLANDQSDNKQVVFDEWHFGRYYLEKLTAQRGEGWQQYKQILDIPKNDDWSAPSLPFLQLHFVSSMFPDTYSIWLGVAVNMLYFVGTCLVLFFISRLLLPDRLALLPLLLWGFSGAAIGIETYTRVYAMSTFFYILLVYVAMCIVKNTCTTSALDGGGGGLRSKCCYVTLGITFFFGLWTHYFFSVWFAMIAIPVFLYLLAKRRFVDIGWCVVTLAIAGVLYLLVNPAIMHTAGANAVHPSFIAVKRVITAYIGHINRFLFAEGFYYIAFIGAVMLVVQVRAVGIKRFVSDKRANFVVLALLLIAMVCYIIILPNIGAGRPPRYVYPIFPTIALTIVFLLWTLSDGKLSRSVFAGLMVAFIFISSTFKHLDQLTVQDKPSLTTLVESNHNVPIIVFANSLVFMPYLMSFDKSIIVNVDDDNYDRLLKIIDEVASDRLITRENDERESVSANTSRYNALAAKLLQERGYEGEYISSGMRLWSKK